MTLSLRGRGVATGFRETIDRKKRATDSIANLSAAPIPLAMSRKYKIVRITMGTLGALALTTLLGDAILQMMRGKGADTYENVYGMQIHWITVLSLAAAVLVAFLVALAIRWWQKRDDRTIDRLLDARRNHDSEHR
jgi:hypothetical protein